MGIFAPMYERKIPLSLNCGLDLIGEVLYGKWKIRLLWFIHEGHTRPGELQRKIPDASRRVLNMQLKESGQVKLWLDELIQFKKMIDHILSTLERKEK